MNSNPGQDQPLRVGIVGANPEKGWAKEAHVPALQKLSGLKLTSVATRSEESARAAAAAFGAERWYDDAFALVRSDEVDVVSICVKVPEHRKILLAALDAGKHVYCEWPLGRNLQEAEELAAAAEHAGVHVAIGLQARLSPAARRARQLVRDGAIGRPLSARIVSTSPVGGPQMPSVYAYLNDPQNGANLSTILGGHTLDLAISVLGKITQIDALSAIHFPSVELIDTNERVERQTPDQLLGVSNLGSRLYNTQAGSSIYVCVKAFGNTRKRLLKSADDIIANTWRGEAAKRCAQKAGVAMAPRRAAQHTVFYSPNCTNPRTTATRCLPYYTTYSYLPRSSRTGLVRGYPSLYPWITGQPSGSFPILASSPQ
jgi:predicted dehydrogenase